MHSFIGKVVAVAVVLTLASVVSAKQASAESGNSFKGSWYNNYASQSHLYVSPAPKTRVIIKKYEPKIVRSNKTAHSKPVLRKKVKLRHYSHSAQPQRRTVHASGYSW